MNSVVLDWNLTLGCVCAWGRERGWGGTRRGGARTHKSIHKRLS